jgi:hypothetical protein
MEICDQSGRNRLDAAPQAGGVHLSERQVPNPASYGFSEAGGTISTGMAKDLAADKGATGRVLRVVKLMMPAASGSAWRPDYAGSATYHP